ncbi:serine/threonine-protein kinase PBL34 isoform X3 [Populus alba]|uniref:serine/threonine-protein kinase PBL34 isoform X3 n=1 Tax=Populus alba TaxID=43335 RepID=UPI00158CB48E|nr:probable serine/threonine-protein kinase PIX7 isoform X3 [Populus alba]
MKMKMGLSPDSVKVKNSNEKSKSKKNRKNDKDEEDMGCWFKLRLLGSCMPSRSKVDSSLSGISTHYAQSKSTNDKNKDQPVVPAMSSTTTTSNTESASSFPTFSEELKLASQLRKFTFNDLKLATRNFRPESLLGEGGFGCVFKGWIEENGTAPVKPGTGLTVAVKTLNHDGLQGHKEWLAEVSFLGNLLHKNLVKLVGYCIEDDQRLLVYEFMPRGSLENHLFRRHLTSKSDVYSFGVVLLEMLTGRRSMDKNRPNGEHNLVEWARPHFGDKRRFYRILDPRLEGHFSIKGAQKAIQLAAQCLSRDPKSRPRMSEVVEALKPLPNLKDMASSSYYFQTMQADRNKSNMNAKNGIRTNAGFITRNGQPLRSLSDVRASPYNQPRQSPKPRGKNS